METRITAVRYPFSKANGYLAVHALENRTLGLCIRMERLWGGLHQRLIFLRRRCVYRRVFLFRTDPALFSFWPTQTLTA
jgi:hypothetical protein